MEKEVKERVIKVKEDIKNISYISVSNDEIWELMIEIANETPDETVVFDMKGIDVKEPWRNNIFPKFLALSNTVLKLYYAKEEKKEIELVARIIGCEGTKVINVENSNSLLVDESKISADIDMEKVDKACEYLKEVTYIEDKVATIRYDKRLTYMEKTETIMGLGKRARELLDEEKVEKVIINVNRVQIQVEKLDTLYNELEKGLLEGKIELVNASKEVGDTLELKVMIGRGQLKRECSAKEKADILRAELKKGTICLLTKYREGKTKDAIGKIGMGQAEWCRIAQFEEIKGNEVVFKAYPGKYFHTKECVLSMGRVPKDLKYEIYKVDINEMGFWDRFISTKYHVNYPVQFKVEDMIVEEICKDENNNDVEPFTKEYLLPEFIKVVMAQYDHEEDYDKEKLEWCIESTKKALGMME